MVVSIMIIEYGNTTTIWSFAEHTKRWFANIYALNCRSACHKTGRAGQNTVNLKRQLNYRRKRRFLGAGTQDNLPKGGHEYCSR
jgi:hypothetical protein